MYIKKGLYLLSIVLSGFFTATDLYAAHFWDYRDIKQFPIQQGIVEPLTQNWVKPTEMTAWGFGKSYVYHHRNLSNIFFNKGEKFLLQPSHVYLLKRDFPFRQSTRSLGMDITIFADLSKERPFDLNSHFSSFDGFDILGNYQFKKNASTRMGDFIGIIAPKTGIVVVIRGTDKNQAKKHEIYYPVGFGLTAGLGIEVDYYPSQWLGFFIEGSLKYSRIVGWLSPPVEGDSEPFTGYKYQKNSYSYYPLAITFGVKTTL